MAPAGRMIVLAGWILLAMIAVERARAMAPAAIPLGRLALRVALGLATVRVAVFYGGSWLVSERPGWEQGIAYAAVVFACMPEAALAPRPLVPAALALSSVGIALAWTALVARFRARLASTPG